jgi:D-alanyl-D-alanine carboxypeptidase/D-alanyl-D-alanine-endopeptidase (penicillin-binding protein 4)
MRSPVAPSPRARLLALLVLPAAWLAPAAAAGAQDATTLQKQLAASMRGASRASGAFVEDLDSDRVLFNARGGIGRIPASVEKLYTTSALWLGLGPSARLQTTVSGRGFQDPDGVWRGGLYLRGGGDPSLSNAGLTALARQVAAAGIVRVSGRVFGDESFFDTARGGPRTDFGYDSDLTGVLGALTVNRGWSKRGGPAAEAARRFSAALEAEGIDVGYRPRVAPTPSGTRTLARLRSPTIAQLTRSTLLPSDNFYAETLLKDLGARTGAGGSTAAGAAVVRSQMASLGLRPVIADGSGLSRANSTSPRQVVRLLGAIHDMPIGTAFEGSMGLVGVSGTVSARMRGTAASRACRAKTGTLRDVSALAGICRTKAGRTVGFAIINNSTSVSRAHTVQDRMVATLARYSG